jgi:hypothetical protein
MRPFLIGAAGLALVGPVALAQSFDHPCRGALQVLLREWNAIGFQTPAKPAQARVAGRNGHDASGAQVTFMQQQIRLAFEDCDKGNEAAVTRRIAVVHNLLGAESQPSG